MLKQGDKVIFVGKSCKEYGIKYGDIFTLISIRKHKCYDICDIGLKFKPGKIGCICADCDEVFYGEFLVSINSLIKASEEDSLNKEIAEALTAPTPVRKFVITSEEQFHAMMEYGKTYLKQKLTIKLTDNFNFDE